MLCNYPEFKKILEQHCLNAQTSNQFLAVFYIDFFNIKDLRYNFEHEFSDTIVDFVITQLVEFFEQSKLNNFFADFCISKINNDKFNILISGFKNPSDITDFAENYSQHFKNRFQFNENIILINLQTGIAVYPEATTLNTNDLIKNANIAMCANVERRRNNYKIYSKEIHDQYTTLSKQYQKEHRIETALHEALEFNYLQLVYQPQYNIKTRKIRGIEALLRLEHPEQGNISPLDLVNVAEKSELITELGAWVMRQACKDFSNWLHAGIIEDGTVISINVSPFQLIKNDFIPLVKNVMEEAKLTVDHLEIEITETAVLTVLEDSKDILSELRKMGIKLSIDDLGTGYSSVSRIKDNLFAVVKIDKSYIDDITSNKISELIVQSVIKLAVMLNYEVIAEGVETLEQLEILKNYRCESIQGYYYSKPLTAKDLIKKIVNDTKPPGL